MLDGAAERFCRRVPTPAHNYDAILETISALVAAAERECGACTTVGIGIPGSLSPRDGRVRNANTTVLNGRAFGSDIVARLGRPVAVANDANCLALSEAFDGAAAGAEMTFGVILGTGVGGGVVVDGRLRAGSNGVAGEWGHLPLPWPRDDERPGPACYCGRFGCIETFLSGPGFARDDSLAAEAPGARTLREPRDIVRAAQGGEPRAEASLERYLDRLARGFATIVDVLDPDVFVLGGGMSHAVPLERLADRVLGYAFTDVLQTRFVRAAHGDASGVRGAARLSAAPEADFAAAKRRP